MAERALTTWSQAYVDALFKSERAKNPLLGSFGEGFARNAFVHTVKVRGFHNVRIDELDDGFGVAVSGTSSGNLMEIVRTAVRYGGEIHFPGALQE